MCATCDSLTPKVCRPHPTTRKALCGVGTMTTDDVQREQASNPAPFLLLRLCNACDHIANRLN